LSDETGTVRVPAFVFVPRSGRVQWMAHPPGPRRNDLDLFLSSIGVPLGESRCLPKRVLKASRNDVTDNYPERFAALTMAALRARTIGADGSLFRRTPDKDSSPDENSPVEEKVVRRSELLLAAVGALLIILSAFENVFLIPPSMGAERLPGHASNPSSTRGPNPLCYASVSSGG
jgi:hypothetical protein